MAERNLFIRLSVVDGGKVKAELSEIGEKGERSLKKIEAAAQPAGNGLKFLSSAANDAKFQLQAATDRLGMLGSVLGKLGPAGLIAGASIAALGVGITALVMPVARVGDEFFKLSQKTGVSVEALTALDYAAKLSDVSTEGLTKGLQRLSVALFDSRFEGAEGSKALQALGVAATDAHGQIRPTEQVLLDLAEKFADMPDGADKAALAIKLFGREGLSLIPFLNQGRDGITALMEEAQRLGLVMSEDVARASEVFNDNLTRLSALFEGVQRQIGAAVIPVLADFTEQVILAQTETGSFSNELQRITSNREATLAFLESVASGLAFIAESAVLLKRVIAQPFDSLSVVGKDIETWFKTELLTFYKNYGFDAQAIDTEIAKLQGARDEYVRAANDRLFNINQNPGYADRVARFFDEQRRTVRVMGQRFVLDTEAQAREVQAIYDRFLPTVPRPPRPPANLDLGAFARPSGAVKPDEGEAFLSQLRTRLLRTQEGEAAELRARALQIEAKGYQGVAAQAERYIQVLEAIERQKESDKAFDAYEKEEAASRKITEGLIGGNRQRIEALQLQREMLDLLASERAVLQARTELEKSATAARKEASQLQDADLRAQTIEAINDALTRQLPIVENLIHSPYLSYRDGDVVFREGGAWVIRHGQPQPFALGQQDAVLKGHLLTGGVSVGGIGSMVLHSNGTDGVEFRFMADRNGTVATALMNTDRAAADYHSANFFMAALMNDGSVRVWGRALTGQQGTGSTGDISRTFPARVAFPPGTPRIASITCMWDETFFIDASGGLWHAGANSDGGSPTATANPVPRRVNGVGQLPANAVVKRVFTGHDWHGYRMFACLDDAGRVYVWGNNRYGSLGLGHSTNVSTPTLVPFTADTPIRDVFLSGGFHAASYLVDTQGKLWVAGEANTCGYGSDQSTHRLLMPWGTEKRVKKVFCSESDGHWVAGAQYYRAYGVVLEDGSLYRWGHDSGQVGGSWGTGFTGDIYTGHALFPYKVLDGVVDAYAISGGYGRTLALMQDGSVRHTGYNGYSIGGGSDRSTWATIGGEFLTQVTKLRMYGSSYGSSAMALRSDGKAVGWGMGAAGQCGNGYADTANAPSRFVLIDRPIVDFSRSGTMGCGEGGEYHNGAYHFLTVDGQVMSTGNGSYAQTGDDDHDHRYAPSPILF